MPIDVASFIYRNRWTLISIAIITPLGFYTKVYSGPAFRWVNNSLGGILYVIFWSLLFYLLFTRIRPIMIVLIVLLVTCTLEILQLWHPDFLEAIRSTFIGVTLMGNSFSWLDIIHYIIGALASVGLLGTLHGRKEHDYHSKINEK